MIGYSRVGQETSSAAAATPASRRTRYVHDREGFTTLFYIKVFAIMEIVMSAG
jgi:hypothetical protein